MANSKNLKQKKSMPRNNLKSVCNARNNISITLKEKRIDRLRLNNILCATGRKANPEIMQHY